MQGTWLISIVHCQGSILWNGDLSLSSCQVQSFCSASERDLLYIHHPCEGIHESVTLKRKKNLINTSHSNMHSVVIKKPAIIVLGETVQENKHTHQCLPKNNDASYAWEKDAPSA